MPEQKKSGAAKFFQNIFCAGGAAVITVSFIHPIDVVKTRLQIAGEAGRQTKQYNGMSGVIKTVIADEGAAAFYKGIGAAWMREASYTSLRLGLYDPMKTLVGADKKDAGILSKFLAGALAGSIGSTAGNPFDVLKTRMMAYEGKDSPGVSHFAREVMDGQGFNGFYKGLSANIMRASILNATKMGCYDSCKTFCKKRGFQDGLQLQFMSAFTAGFFMTCTVSPFDIIRTRLMNQPSDAKIYNGFVDCFAKILKNEGPLGFYKGFMPIWGRFAPTTCLQLVIFEQLRKVVGLGGI
mmetsp:Transcript_5663/g.8963  ORF Transcript_5663/g.8963 Transcript_5663/m.8963 type:complete len:295 (-) Transcript_5663:82-966(-)